MSVSLIYPNPFHNKKQCSKFHNWNLLFWEKNWIKWILLTQFATMKIFYIAIFFFFLSIRANSQNYSYYFGNIHAHSSFSDGNKDSLTSLLTTPFQNFEYAKNSEHIYFYVISEHNHAGA